MPDGLFFRDEAILGRIRIVIIFKFYHDFDEDVINRTKH